MKRTWAIKEKISETTIKKFPDYDPVILQLLFNRGLKTAGEFEAFFKPAYESLASPFLFAGMTQAVRRILSAILDRQKITIYADYDADAVTACAVLYRALLKLGAAVDSYIPDRFAEGYGLNEQAIQEISERGTRLIITVDCGTNAVSEVDRANSLGMDVVITDHHEIIGALPRAYSVVNPKRNQELNKLQGLTGVGVAFKLVQAIFASLHPKDYRQSFGWQVPDANSDLPQTLVERALPQWEKWLLDLVAIGTIADCQSLMDENRVLVKYGLRVLAKTKWAGLRQIIRNAGIAEDGNFDAFLVGFVIAPRINAAGRIQHADIAFRLLVADDPVEASMYAGQLESLNSHRQRLTEQIVAEARLQIVDQADQKILLAVGKNWPKGVVGLVASRLTEEFARPTVVLERGDKIATGSARSVGGFNIVEAFAFVSGYLDRFGGHAQAAGLTIRNEHIPKFHSGLLEFAGKNLSEEQLVKRQEIDCVIEPEMITDSLLEKLKFFEPYGADNSPVSFLIKDLVLENLKPVGATGKHLKLHASAGDRALEFIGFGQGYRQGVLRPGEKLDIVVEPSFNTWNGFRKIQLKIIDLVIAA